MQNVVRLYEVIDDGDQEKLLMVMEYVEGGSVLAGSNPFCTVGLRAQIPRGGGLGLKHAQGGRRMNVGACTPVARSLRVHCPLGPCF